MTHVFSPPHLTQADVEVALLLSFLGFEPPACIRQQHPLQATLGTGTIEWNVKC